jgi:hypothetical protein
MANPMIGSVSDNMYGMWILELQSMESGLETQEI